MKVWVFQTGEPLIIDGFHLRPMRAMNLTNLLIDAGHDVTLWSNDFIHQEKKFRFGYDKNIQVSEKFQIRLICSRGYNKNIGLARLIDHFQLAYKLKKELKSEKNIPDVVFIGFPPIETSAVLSSWSKRNSIPVILDIKDQWPSLFVDVLPWFIKPFGQIILWPYFYLAKRTMRDVTAISSMTTSFIEWSNQFSGRKPSKFDAVFPLTSPCIETSLHEMEYAQKWWNELGIHDDDIPKVCFVGSISQAFDFSPIKEAAEYAIKSNIDIKFIICGEGGCSEVIKTLLSKFPNIIFPGWINRPKIEVLAGRCLASLAPYRNINNFIANIPNKIIDSLSLGLPILSPLEGEVKQLIDCYNIGLSYREGSGKELFECIVRLDRDLGLSSNLANNAIKLYSDKFSYEVVYGKLVKHIEGLSKL